MEKEWKHRTVARRAGESVKSSVKRTTKSIKHISKEFGLFMGDGRILQYAIGMVIGTAFTTVINSLVSDLLSPFIGLAIGTQFENFYVVLKKPSDEICNKNATLCNFHTPADARAVGAVTWNLGSFFQTMLNFLIIAFSLFSNLAEYFGKDPNQSFHDLKECSYCLSHIPARASRCAHCTAAVEISVEYLDFDHKGKEGGKGKNVQFDMNFSSIPFRI
ncbi:large-conductance mechanosensitive channel [Obelidium mucronatum]|nr:large-conductance mechanosensitive channel [Obelidium mucronatum]